MMSELQGQTASISRGGEGNGSYRLDCDPGIILPRAHSRRDVATSIEIMRTMIDRSLSRENEIEVAPLIRLATSTGEHRQFQVLREWIGEIVEVKADSVVALLDEADDSTHHAEIVELPISDFAPGDTDLLKSGSTFYWSIGYETSIGGSVVRQSEIRMRRMPSWSPNNVESLRSTARKMLAEMSGADESGSE